MFHSIFGLSVKFVLSYILFAPLVSAILARTVLNKKDSIISGWISSLVMLDITCASWILFYNLYFVHDVLPQQFVLWSLIDQMNINWAVSVDHITALMLVMISTVSCVVHFYSIGYIRGSARDNSFFAFISMFTSFMFLMVMSTNMLQIFVGWEGVGLSSYLLIGFWHKKDSANKAAMKAFVVNRLGDCGFVMAMAILYGLVGSLDLVDIAYFYRDGCGSHQCALLLVYFCLLAACMAKSAQLGLHVWLHDAMEGPTPVSALIHAATMVTAGVFLFAKFISSLPSIAFFDAFVTIVGIKTAVIAALIACAQTDIKKAIAYSTCSQLGYMFIACGLRAYDAALFHMFTHAFFKGLLFLCAGNVIHALSGEQNLFRMGGMRRYLPFTFAAMLCGSLAISGIWPLSGFYSKDHILEVAYSAGGYVGLSAFYFGIFAAILTAFYSTKIMLMVFCGRTHEEAKLHGISPYMNYSLLVLIIGSIFVGGIMKKWGVVSGAFFCNTFKVGMMAHVHVDAAAAHAHSTDFWAQLAHYMPIIASLSGIMLAFAWYAYKFLPVDKAETCGNCRVSGLICKILANKFYFDEIYNYLFVQPYNKLCNYMKEAVEKSFVTSIFVALPVNIQQIMSKTAVSIQSGLVGHYVFLMLFGVIIMMLLVI